MKLKTIPSNEVKGQRPKSTLGGWIYRSQQFFGAFLGRVSDEDLEDAHRVLGPRLYEMFAEMPGQYRLHMLTVYRRVRRAGCNDPRVWQAALLHDAGKYDPASGVYVSLVYRVLIVLLEATAPGKRLFRRFARAQATVGTGEDTGALARKMGWRYPFYLSRHHAQLGAQQAANHGAPAEVVRLIANHHKRHTPDAKLAA